MITAKKVMELLVESGWAEEAEMVKYVEGWRKWKSPEVKSSKIHVGDETYGSKSFLYFSSKDGGDLIQLAKVIGDEGGEVDWSWGGGNDNAKNFELRVHGFKGWHHWE